MHPDSILTAFRAAPSRVRPVAHNARGGRLLALAPIASLAIFGAFWSLTAPAASAGDVPSQLSGLSAGNRRFADGETTRPHQTFERRSEVASAQEPFAVVVGCADSRVPPELVFDQGLGDLFVVRCAGNVVEGVALGSIEYAVEHLGCELVVVLAHERCGAVAAVVDNAELAGHMSFFAPPIEPSVLAARTIGGDVLDNAVRLNALRVAAELRASEPILSQRASAGRLAVVAARYDLDTGVVEWLDAAGATESPVPADLPGR